ncbi:hypothetical protein AMECASPLE_037582 [Ameca splendens]|uniref:Uncharacterized protein n=1 Tax=Ameca splendens TaxID=208324 RepID=A0ABV0ZTS5_9TELE
MDKELAFQTFHCIEICSAVKIREQTGLGSEKGQLTSLQTPHIPETNHLGLTFRSALQSSICKNQPQRQFLHPGCRSYEHLPRYIDTMHICTNSTVSSSFVKTLYIQYRPKVWTHLLIQRVVFIFMTMNIVASH